MKFLILGILSLGLNAFAQDNVLSQSEMTLSSNSLILEKPANGPSFIVLNVPVPTTQNVCVLYQERQTYGANGAVCGYDTVERQDCSMGGGFYPGGGVVVRRGPVRGGVVRRGPIGGGVVRRGPIGGGVVRRGPIGGGVVRRGGPIGGVGVRCRVYTENVPRSCYYMERFCAESETQVNNVYKKFNLEFDKFSSEAKINFTLDENNNLTLDVISMPESCIKKTTYGSNQSVTGAKLKLKSRCR